MEEARRGKFQKTHASTNVRRRHWLWHKYPAYNFSALVAKAVREKQHRFALRNLFLIN